MMVHKIPSCAFRARPENSQILFRWMSMATPLPYNIFDLSLFTAKATPFPSMHRPAGKRQTHRRKFLEGRGAGRENLFPKRFPSPQAFLSSNLQASACRPCRTMFFLRGDSLARSPTRHCSPAGERVSGTGTNIDDNSARPFPKTKKSPAERGQKKTPSR